GHRQSAPRPPRQLPSFAPCLRHAHAGERGRRAHHPATAGPREAGDDADLHRSLHQALAGNAREDASGQPVKGSFLSRRWLLKGTILMRWFFQLCALLLVLLSTETHAWGKIDVSEKIASGGPAAILVDCTDPDAPPT